jgi:hypothetical protein
MSKKNFVTMMNIMDDNKHLIPEGDYLKFCNAIKGEFMTTDTESLRQEILIHKETITSNEEEIEELEEELTSEHTHTHEWKMVAITRTKLLKKAFDNNKKTKTFTSVEHKFIGTMLSQDSRVELSGRGEKRERNIVTQIEAPMDDIGESKHITISDINDMPLMMRRLM